MTKIGKIIPLAISLVAATTTIVINTGTISELSSPWRMYVCDFRLISAATCNLPMAAHTIRVTVTAAEADRIRRIARRDRIVSCEREKTAHRMNGEPVAVRKCWNEVPNSFAWVSSR